MNQLKDPEFRESPKYTEYRNGIIKIFGKRLGGAKNGDDFVDKILSSQDLKKLLFDTTLCKNLDEMGGIPKIFLTILSKYAETYY